MTVYELTACEEYQWQESLGLFASIEAIKREYPEYSETIDSGYAGLVVIVLPEWKQEVTEAFKQQGYWWYNLPRHGMTEDYEKQMFLGIIEREVKE